MKETGKSIPIEYAPTLTSPHFPLVVKIDNARVTDLLVKEGTTPEHLDQTSILIRGGRQARGGYSDGSVPLTYFSGYKPTSERKIVLEVPMKVDLKQVPKIEEILDESLLTSIYYASQDSKRALYRNSFWEETLIEGSTQIPFILAYAEFAPKTVSSGQEMLLWMGGLFGGMYVVHRLTNLALDKLNITLGETNRAAKRFIRAIQSESGYQPLVTVGLR